MTSERIRHPFFVHRCMQRFSAALGRAGVGPEPVLLGVSGGSDSMALLEIAGLVAPTLDLEVHVCCVDHGLRAEAALESSAVEAAALRWGATFHAVRVEPGGDDEDSLRRARHDALDAVRCRIGARFVLLGHTADDQIETMLFRFLRGAGFGGLAGMREIRGSLLRPLLAMRREELQGLLRARGVAWAEDPTNQSVRYARGRLRASVLPAVAAAFGAGSLDHLLDVAPRWRADEDFLEQEAERLQAYASRRGANGSDLDIESLSTAHEALRARVLRRWITAATGISPASRDVAEVERWLDKGRGSGRLDIAGARLALAGGRLSVSRAGSLSERIRDSRGARR
jgi:tRNA(Ile)-lysidine synthase